MILVSPAEPADFRKLGDVSGVCESQYGADFVIPGNGFVAAVQRKSFPADFLSSVRDGRFATLLPKMLNADLRILMLEGRPRWTGSGGLLNYDYGGGREFRRAHLRGMEWSLAHVWGVHTLWTDDALDSVEFLKDLARWAAKDRHDALGNRPGPQSLPHRKPSPRNLGVHLLQGFPGIGQEMAGRIYDHFDRVPLAWDVAESDMAEVPGVGKGRIATLGDMIPFRPPTPDPEFSVEVSG